MEMAIGEGTNFILRADAEYLKRQLVESERTMETER